MPFAKWIRDEPGSQLDFTQIVDVLVLGIAAPASALRAFGAPIVMLMIVGSLSLVTHPRTTTYGQCIKGCSSELRRMNQ
jgi:hypothetical protein